MKVSASDLLQKVVQELCITPNQHKWLGAAALFHVQPYGDERLAFMAGSLCNALSRMTIPVIFPMSDMRK